MTDPTGTTPSSPTPPARPASSLRYKVAVVLAVLLAVAAFALAGLRANTGDDAPVTVSGRPDVVEHLTPPHGAQALRQSEFGIDLAPGYEGTLVVLGMEIPRDQLRLVPEQNQVFFTPGPGKVIEELDAGETCVTAIVWRSADGRGVRDQSFRWCFGVT